MKAYLKSLADAGKWDELNAILKEFKLHEKYNVVERFKPYDYQMEMFNAGATHKARFACLANRCGKTFSGAREMSYHLTGLYPDWWEGHKFNEPIKAWAIGITTDSTRKVLQYELLGTIDARDVDMVGTGAISRDHININALEKDGPSAKVVRVAHHDKNGEVDGISELEFRSTQQGLQVLMGTSQHFIWLDEEAPQHSLEIFSQCSTRTATTDGRVLITATPENGETPLIQKFYETEQLFIHHVGWDQVPHLSEKVKNDLIATYPSWEVECRTKGMPSKGSGAIFKVDDEFISFPSITPKANWPIVAGVDFGRSRDPSTIVFSALDPDTGVSYMFEEHYLDKDRSPAAMARIILESKYPQIPVVVPHDGNSVSTDGGNETRATIMRNAGCNMMRSTFSNPSDIQNSITDIRKKHMGKEGGLAWMDHQFRDGKMKVCEHLLHFFREKRSYFYVTRGGKTMPKDGDDHIIDAARISALSLGRYGVPAAQCYSTPQDFNNGFTMGDNNAPQWDAEDNTIRW